MPKLLIALLLLAACGADGAPEPPAPKKDGISITGQARVGVVYNK